MEKFENLFHSIHVTRFFFMEKCIPILCRRSCIWFGSKNAMHGMHFSALFLCTDCFLVVQIGIVQCTLRAKYVLQTVQQGTSDRTRDKKVNYFTALSLSQTAPSKFKLFKKKVRSSTRYTVTTFYSITNVFYKVICTTSLCYKFYI